MKEPVFGHPHEEMCHLETGCSCNATLCWGRTVRISVCSLKDRSSEAARCLALAAALLVFGGVWAQESSPGKFNKNGNILISDQFNHQVIEVTQAGQIVFSYGVIGIVGRSPNELNAPYDAKVIGDYTGITKPPTPPSAGMGGAGN